MLSKVEVEQRIDTWKKWEKMRREGHTFRSGGFPTASEVLEVVAFKDAEIRQLRARSGMADDIMEVTGWEREDFLRLLAAAREIDSTFITVSDKAELCPAEKALKDALLALSHVVSGVAV